MIKLKHISKSFNRGSQNEVKAVVDFSIDFPKKGLVTLFGHSGSGKTTVLNIVGGLDKPTNGDVYYGDSVIKNFDEIRSRRIGYVFQNYNLFTNLSVFDNVSFVLKMIGVNDEEFIKEQVEYALDLVNMLPFAKKKANELSGGQQQRVAIARALVKNPDFIIADEPTGNIDSKNKLEVMNIFRKIADQKLVILVTHEEHLAKYYSDRIITMVDGVVVDDKINTPQLSHDFVDDNKIFLNDLSHDKIDSSDLQIDYYYDNKPNINVKLIYQNGALYIHLPTDVKASLINDDSSIQTVEQSRSDIDDSLVETEFDVNNLEVDSNKVGKRQLFSLKTMLKVSFSKLFNVRKRRKLMYVALLLAGLLFGVGITQFGAAIMPIPTSDVPVDGAYYKVSPTVKGDNLNPADFNNIYLQSNVKSINVSTINPGYQSSINSKGVQVAPSNYLINNEFIHGKNINAKNEVVVSKELAESFIVAGTMGIWHIKDLVGRTIIYSNYNFTISGIVSRAGSSLYFDQQLLQSTYIEQMFNEGQKTYFLRNDISKEVTLIEGRKPANIYENDEIEVLISKEIWNRQMPDATTFSEFNLQNENSFTDTTLFALRDFNSPEGIKFKVVGIISDGKNYIIANQEALEKVYRSAALQIPDIQIYTTDKAVITNLSSKYNVENIRESVINYYTAQKTSTIIGTSIINAIIISLSGLGIFFMNRSEMSKQIYQINVYRSLGVKKWEIIKTFVIDILVLTTVTILIGYFIYVAIYVRFASGPFGIFGIATVNALIIFLGVFLIYIISLIAGLIPILLLLRKTPANLMKTFDI